LDSNDYPHVSYTGPDSYVFHAWQDAGGTNLERLGRTGGSWPPPSSVIAMDTNGHPMVAYLEIYPPGPPTTRIVVEMFNGASWTTNAVISRPGADFGFWGSKLVQDLKLDKAGQPAIVVSYTDHASGAAATFWIDFYTWDGSSWTGGHIGTFPNTPGCGQVSLVFDNAGRPFVGTVMELGGTANKGVYILTTIPPPPAGTIFTVQ